MLLSRDIPALAGALFMAFGSTNAIPLAGDAPKCNHNNCYLNLFDSRYIATAQAFCPGFLSSTTTAASAIPTAFKNCKGDTAAVSSACSCIVYSAPTSSLVSSSTTVTTTLSTTTTTSSSSTSTSAPAVTLGPATPTCRKDNCYLNFLDKRYIATAQDFCPGFLAATTTEAPAIPTVFKNCKSDITRVSSACSCIVGPPTTTPTSSTTPTSTAAPVCTASPDQLILNPGFEDDGLTGSPWSFDLIDGATTVNDPDHSHSGDWFVLASVPAYRESHSISQTINDLDPSHEYTVSYFWSLTNKQEIYTGDCSITTYADDALLDSLHTKRVTPYAYSLHNVIFTPATPSVTLRFVFSCSQADYFYGADFVADDFSLVQSCPACSVLDTPPAGAQCGLVGRATANGVSLGNGDASSEGNCAESCATTEGCAAIAFFDGPAHYGSASRCYLYSAPVARLGFTPDQNFYTYSDVGCFSCGAQELTV